MAAALPGALAEGGSGEWATVGVTVLVAGGQLANLLSRDRRARHDDLPMLFHKLEEVLAPFKRSARSTAPAPVPPVVGVLARDCYS